MFMLQVLAVAALLRLVFGRALEGGAVIVVAAVLVAGSYWCGWALGRWQSRRADRRRAETLPHPRMLPPTTLHAHVADPVGRSVGAIETCGATPEGEWKADDAGHLTWAEDPFAHWGAYGACTLPSGHRDEDPESLSYFPWHSWQAVLRCERCGGTIRPYEAVTVDAAGKAEHHGGQCPSRAAA
jgi:hypothetical protein